MVKFMFINKSALRRCCVGIALSSLCSVSGMSSLTPEMINEVMLKETVDKYKEVIRGMRDYKNRVCIGLVLQTLVDNSKISIEGFVKGRISDDLWDTVVKFAGSLNDECSWLYGYPYTVVEKYIDSLGVWKSADESDNQSFIRRLFRNKVAKSHAIDVFWLTKGFVDQCVEKMVAGRVVTKDEIEVVTGPSFDLIDVPDNIKRILPRGEYFRDFIVILSELDERCGYSIALPSVSDFVNLGRRFIALVAEKSELEKKCSLTAEEVKKIKDEKIKVENELKQIKEQFESAWRYATDGVYSSHGGVKVVKTIESANLNGVTSGTNIEQVGVYNSEKFGLVSKKNEEKAKLLDNETHDIYNKGTEGVYDKTAQIVLTKKEIAKETTDRETENTFRKDLYASDLRIKGNALRYELTRRCRKPTGKKAKQEIRDKAELELEQIFPYIKTIASLYDVNYSNFNCAEMSLLVFVKADLRDVTCWRNVNPYTKIYAERAKDMIDGTFLEWLVSARLAAFSAAHTDTDNMVQCKIGGATNKDNLMLQLLGAAIAGYDVEDIKKTF